jgi:hypothetical protein
MTPAFRLTMLWVVGAAIFVLSALTRQLGLLYSTPAGQTYARLYEIVR